MGNSCMSKRVKVQTIIPEEWLPKIKEHMVRKGYYSMGEFLRDLIRRELAGLDSKTPHYRELASPQQPSPRSSKVGVPHAEEKDSTC